MRLTTLFKALERVRDEIASAEKDRGVFWGIAVDKDKFALRWQRYNRFYNALRARLLDRLSKIDRGEAA